MVGYTKWVCWSAQAIKIMESSGPSLTDLLYYCVPNKRGYLRQLTLPFIQFSAGAFHQQASRQSAFQSLSYRNTLGFLGKQYSNLNVVCIPACDILLTTAPKPSPLCYVKTDKPTAIECYLSGHRSAILLKDSKVYRLKGCGNDFNGFEMVPGNGLRGCHFYHTSKREMLMTHLVNQVMRENNREIANTPVGFYQYQRGFLKQLPEGDKIRDDLGLLSKYCCVFETKGERRVGTHLISSLEVLIATYLQTEKEPLKQLFVTAGRYEDNAPTDSPTEWLFEELDNTKTFYSELIKKHTENKQPLNLIDYFATPISKTPIDVVDIDSKTDQMVKVYKTHPDFVGLLKEQLDGVFKSGKLLELIMLLAAKIGYEVGQIKRLLMQKGINWGFFNDHNIWHCNAHLNNFIVLKPQAGKDLLAPLDFDLAFTKKEFIEITRDSPNYGQNDSKAFEDLMQGGYSALQLSISGMELMNFQYGIYKGEHFETFKLLKAMFRDTLVRFYVLGATNQKMPADITDKYEASIELLKSLVTASLIISMDFQT